MYAFVLKRHKYIHYTIHYLSLKGPLLGGSNYLYSADLFVFLYSKYRHGSCPIMDKLDWSLEARKDEIVIVVKKAETKSGKKKG
jgi:hypothetical protein